ncbi:MAG: hypothetical protein AB2L14_09685 [Candidatus Xenobiia bacterium LiM19]
MSEIILILLGIVCLAAVLTLGRTPMLIIGSLVYFALLYLVLQRAWSCMVYLPILISLLSLGILYEMYRQKKKKLIMTIPLLLVVLCWLLFFLCDHSNHQYQVERERMLRKERSQVNRTFPGKGWSVATATVELPIPRSPLHP